MPRRRSIVAAIGLLITLGNAAEAAPTRFETVVHGEANDAGEADPTALVSRVDTAEAAPGTELADHLRGVPSLQVRDYGSGQAKLVTLRGVEPHQVAVFLDGVRLTDPGQPTIDLSLFDPLQLASVEVYRSGGSSRFGAGAVGGAVLLHSATAARGPRTRLGASYGSWQTLTAHAGQRARIGRARLALSAAYRRSAGDFPFIDHNRQTTRRRNNDGQLGELLLRLDNASAAPWRVGLLASLGGAWRGAPGMMQRPSERARQTNLRALLALHVSRHALLGARGGRLDLRLFQRFGHFRFSEPAPPPVESESNSAGLGGIAEATLPLRPWLRLRPGVELRSDLFFGADAGARERLSTEGWLAAELSPLGRQLVLTPTLRWTRSSDFGGRWVPALGLLLQPWVDRHAELQATDDRLSSLQLRASFGRSLRFPSYQEQFLRVDGFGPNPDLQPEDALAFDAALSWAPLPRIALELGVFRRWIDNVILVAPVSSFLIRPDNFSGADTTGAELSLQATLPAGLRVGATYCLLQTRLAQTGLALPAHPRHQGSLELSWAFSGLSGSPQWLGPLRLASSLAVQSGIGLDRFGNAREEGRVLAAASARYTLRGFTLSLEGRNLLDKRDAVDSVGFPLPPARVFLALAWER
ncbi:MAG: TonB-dependent receptor [Proteobacteria bacterium]|nr:TonB-dependent receptor [Pseudomonadota bacterium]